MLNEKQTALVLQQFTRLSSAAASESHRCKVNGVMNPRCEWVQVRVPDFQGLVFVCSRGGMIHVCGAGFCRETTRNDGAITCCVRGRRIEPGILAGSAFEEDSSGHADNRGKITGSGLELGDGSAARATQAHATAMAQLMAGGRAGKAPPDIRSRRKLEESFTKSLIVDVIQQLLNSDTARSIRDAVFQKARGSILASVSDCLAVIDTEFHVTNMAAAAMNVYTQFFLKLQEVALPEETFPSRFIDNLAANICQIAMHVEQSPPPQYRAKRKAPKDIGPEVFVFVCVTQLVDGFDHREKGVSIPACPELGRFLITSPSSFCNTDVRRYAISSMSGLLIHGLSAWGSRLRLLFVP